jgi:L-amino acid N-acyltransferase YncA
MAITQAVLPQAAAPNQPKQPRRDVCAVMASKTRGAAQRCRLSLAQPLRDDLGPDNPQPSAMLIRTARPTDAEAITAIYAPIVVNTPISFELEPPNVEEMRQRINNTLKTLPWLVAVNAQDQVMGYVYASKWRERLAYQWSVEVTAYVHENARGQGLASKLYTRLFEILAGLGYVQAFGGITLPNVPSVRLHESLGFVHIGSFKNVGHKMGQWRDVGYWQKNLQALTTPQALKVFDAGA